MSTPAYSPTPSASQHFHPTYYPQHGYYHPQAEMNHMQMAPGAHQLAQGRVALPHHGMPPNIVNINPNGTPSPLTDDEYGPSPFLPEEEGNSPYGQHLELPPVNDVSPVMMHTHIVSPTEHLEMGRYEFQRTHSMPAPIHHPHPHHRQSRLSRPQMQQRQTMQFPPRQAQLHRQASLQLPARSASPHMMAGDVFDLAPSSPVKRPSSSLGLMEHHAGPSEHRQEMTYHFVPDMGYYQNAQGISPARALGPAPMHPQRFSPHHDDLMITPQMPKSGYPSHVPSSATSSTVTTGSSSATESGSSVSSVDQAKRHPTDASDEETESPTRGPSASRAMSKMQLNERGQAHSGAMKVLPPRIPTVVMRPSRPPPKPVVIGGRTSAKFAKVAEDPGVEGVPPGPRSIDRPGPSFACIIGQAILKCSAGGLSLEHIYRYVETAYPYFKTGDGAWRNSVRHNLSIHKMFETIPRTEKFPPGKGGIWIIHDDEKCHWPEENKFIKNFPSTHHHHGVCRQTLHERTKEKDAMEKAAREGRMYVPKKGKKGRKLPMKEDEDDPVEMTRSSSAMSDGPQYLQRVPSHQSAIHAMGPPDSFTPRIQAKTIRPPPMAPPELDFEVGMEDDGDFLPMDELHHPSPEETSPIEIPASREDKLARSGAMKPPRFERKRKTPEEDDNVFTSTKRVRVAEPMPHHHEYLDDSFITPERERPVSTSKGTWSSFKTPALVNTSSSPGSSPMPPTITRSTHHPSGLQQAWTQDDMVRSADTSSPARPMLDAAFDFQPKSKVPPRARAIAAEDDFLPSHTSHSPRPPKTPVTRSSAATDKTPRFQLARTPLGKTPLLFGSPALPPPSANALLSTPLWEVGGCLDRLRDYGGSPTHSIRSPMPPTSPTRYAMLLDSRASPRKMMRDFTV